MSDETMAARIERRLQDSLAPARLKVVDDSHRHAGHSGWREGGETHFRVEIVAPAFEGLSRIARQRMVYDALRAELEERVHALQVRTLTPAEDAARRTS